MSGSYRGLEYREQSAAGGSSQPLQHNAFIVDSLSTSTALSNVLDIAYV